MKIIDRLKQGDLGTVKTEIAIHPTAIAAIAIAGAIAYLLIIAYKKTR
jgi:hypothetical protein